MIALNESHRHLYSRESDAIPTAGEIKSYQSVVTEKANVTPGTSILAPIGPAHRGNALNAEMPETLGTVDRVYHSSWKAMLARNLGRDVIVSFLIGTQDTVVAHGELYEVGSDYLVLYQNEQDSYITADLYAVKFVEFIAQTVDVRPRM